MMDNIRLGARLRAARKAAGFKTSKAFINKFKIPASTYSQHESGARTPDDQAIKYYSNIFGISFNWLKLGKGYPYKDESKIKKNIIKEELLDISKIQHSTRNFIDQKIFSYILENLIKFNIINVSNYKISLIVKNTFSIYNSLDFQRLNTSEIKSQINITLNSYKKLSLKKLNSN